MLCIVSTDKPCTSVGDFWFPCWPLIYSLEAWGWPWEGLFLPLTPYTLEGEYFLQTALDLASCHDWVVTRVMPLMLCGPWIAQRVMSVTRQVVQIGLCMGTTRTGCNRRVFSPGRSAPTRETGLSSVFLLGTKQLPQCTFLQYSPVGMYLSAGRWLYILGEAVSTVNVLFFSVSELPFVFF